MRRFLLTICLSSLVFAGAAGCASSKEKKEDKSAKAAENRYEKSLSEKQAELDESKKRVQKLEAQLEREHQLADRREALRKELQKELADLLDAGKIEITTRRGRLVVLLPHKVLFASGKFDLTDHGEQALQSVSSALGDLEKHRVLVAGHTDDVAVSDKQLDFANNWELSTMRAQSAATVLEKAGMPSGQLGVAGFGSNDPLVKNDSEENRQTNRRVELMLIPDLSEVIHRSRAQRGMPKNQGKELTKSSGQNEN